MMYGLTCSRCGDVIERKTEEEAYLAAKKLDWCYVKDDFGNWHNICSSCIEDDDETEELSW